MKSASSILFACKATNNVSVDVKLLRFARRFSTGKSVPAMTVSKELETRVRREPVEFQLSSGDTITVDSVIQDTKPEGSSIGTVIALHGSPGSHKDFKYITSLLHEKDIRVIGINFPGYGNSADHQQLKFDNVERDNYVKSVIEKTGVKEKYVVMGHSRGCENATGVASQLSDSVSGLVLVNPTGLGQHRALRPMWIIHFVIWLYDLGSIAQKIMNPFLVWLYNSILGLRLDTGPRAMNCVRTMSQVELGNLRPKIDKLNEAKDVSVLIAYAGKDMLVEVPVSSELADYYRSHSAIKCGDKPNEGDDEVISEMKQLYNNGTKTVSVLFKKDGHFLQKTRARFIAESVETILKKL